MVDWVFLFCPAQKDSTFRQFVDPEEAGVAMSNFHERERRARNKECFDFAFYGFLCFL